LKLKNRLPEWLDKISGWLYLPDTWNFTGLLNPLARGQMPGWRSSRACCSSARA
jgi:hypothetical protein